jgi:ubiquinol-cytochrome c reductase iron-sulfur subunit
MLRSIFKVRPQSVIHSAAPFRLASASTSSKKYESFDNGFENDRIIKTSNSNEDNNRAFTSFMLGGARVIYASAARLALITFISNMSASADVLALANAEFDISGVAEGSTIVVKWRGKVRNKENLPHHTIQINATMCFFQPVFVKHRIPAEICAEATTPMSMLRDPELDKNRTQVPKYLIAVAVCTHLGRVPIANAGDYVRLSFDHSPSLLLKSFICSLF